MKIGLTGLVLVDASFRHTGDPLGGAPDGQHPQTDVPMEVVLLKGEIPNTFAVKLRVAIESLMAHYNLSVTYVTLLNLELEEGEVAPPDLDHRIMVVGATMAFPYCREVVSNLTGRSRFGAIWLNPTNFNDLLKPKNAETAAAQ